MPLVESKPDQVARTYASAIFELAASSGGPARAERVLSDLHDILEIAREDRRFGEFLASMVVPSSARDASLERILAGRADDLTVRAIRLLNRKGRLGHLHAITAALDELVQSAFGRIEVDVFTAAALDARERESLRGKISGKLGKDVVLHAYTEPAMLGGIKLRIGDQLVDDSLATQLRRVRDKLTTQGGPRVRSSAGRIIEPG